MKAREQSAVHHTRTGNCLDNAAVYGCRACGRDVMCDVCHEHEAPRGDCGKCPTCPACTPLAAGKGGDR